MHQPCLLQVIIIKGLVHPFRTDSEREDWIVDRILALPQPEDERYAVRFRELLKRAEKAERDRERFRVAVNELRDQDPRPVPQGDVTDEMVARFRASAFASTFSGEPTDERIRAALVAALGVGRHD